MIELYNKISIHTSSNITSTYSTSFSLGIRALANKHQNPIKAVYGFVRVADEIVDTFHQYNKQELLTEFRSETFKAIERGISTNPVLHSFQQVVNQYGIERHLIEAFLESMEMDLYYTEHPLERYNKYIYGSAEVVGLMCLYIFCDGQKSKYEELESGAKKLGAAFQKINFLRDLKSDIDERGRLYFPNLKNVMYFDYETKVSIEKDIESDFREALVAIKQLPISSRFGVYIAYIYFFQLLKNIKKLKPKSVLEKRIRVSNPMKVFLFVQGWMRFRFNLL